MTRVSLVTALLMGGVWAMPAIAQQATDAVAPEAGSPETESADVFAGLGEAAGAALASKEEGKPVTAQNWMVAAANPLAVEAGAKVLERGGSAADAMVAVQTVLGLVEPQSSGLGGGAFLVWYDAESGELTTLDGRETAPLAATPTYFQDENGEPLEFYDAVVGGRSVGTPGTPALLEEAHRRWGKVNWGSLFDDAITLADEGFTVSPRLAALVADDSERLGRFPATKAYFFPDGQAIAAGDMLENPEYAHVLRRLAAEGSRAFYSGEIAEGIADTVRNAEGNPGLLSVDDLAAYKVKERPAVCAEYRDHEVCGMGPPSSGGLTVGQILGMLGGYDLAALGAENPESWRLIGDASRLAFADRGRYMADSDFVPVPSEGLIAPDYLAERGELLGGDDSLPEVSAGSPGWSHAMNWGQDSSLELPSTSHISIVDADGNALSMTTTIENGFGSRLFTQGFLLNNELTDFSFETHDEAGYPIANRLEPGKRPRSSMAPSIVMKDGKPVLVIGSPGGSRIIGYVAKAIIGYIDWGMDVQQAVALPNIVNRFGTMDVEAGTPATDLTQALTDIGFEVEEADLNSGLHGIAITPDGLSGGADPRREGVAIGD
ncbi:gamma-glutamyltransferase [Paracoccus saliphilus]|uniref:Glutathione hydrolase proenzyme n=1 Tax=Paracoccus saliphilus TaxID=405559 RepID=A0AA45W512_9RHOB|nr:gamma-glutamyltransferase [Paracoccus saliphilus]WCR04724.1 gamma-glutamyltransferase [Paracoccus saliphilus]SIS88821.1 gamma-glutamyltransferase 1 Threonine peptidase. MEROPS family T03 [Paracoccus saliphilus]